MTERTYPVSGDIDLATAEELQADLLVLVNANGDDLVLDCARLEFIDSTGIAVLLHTQRLLEIQGRTMRVRNLTGMPRRSLDILGLTEVLESVRDPRSRE